MTVSRAGGRSYKAIAADFDRLGLHSAGPLVELLSSGDRYARQIAARELGRMRVRQAVQPLASALSKEDAADADGLAAAEAARALGEMGVAATAAPPLPARLRDPRSRVRAAAARAPGKLHDDRAVTDIAMALQHPDLRVRAAAATVLGDLCAAGATPELVRALADDPWVAREAAMALANIGRSDGVPQLIDALKALGTPTDDERITIVRAMARLHDPRTRDVLQWAATDQYSSPALKREAEQALQEMNRNNSRDAQPPLQRR